MHSGGHVAAASLRTPHPRSHVPVVVQFVAGEQQRGEDGSSGQRSHALIVGGKRSREAAAARDETVPIADKPALPECRADSSMLLRKERLVGAYTQKRPRQPLAGAPAMRSGVAEDRARAATGFAHDFSRVASRSEQDADRIAEQTTERREPSLTPRAMLTSDVPALPSALGSVLAEPAQPLDHRARQLLAPRLGAAADDIRIHDNPPAHRAARALGASAFAVGRHIVFSEGRYRPGTSGGNRLIAHEAAHLEQQAARGSARIDCKPDPAPETLPKRYKPLLDRIQVEEKSRKESLIGGWHLRVLWNLEELALAAEAGDLERTKTAVTDFVTSAEKNSLDPASAVLLGDVPMMIVSRVFLIGLQSESKRLEDHFFAKGATYDRPTSRGGYAMRYQVLARISEDAIASATFADAARAERDIDLILLAFRGVTDAAAALDPVAVKKDQEAARQEASYASATSTLYDLGRNPDQTIGGHYSHLLGLLPALITAMQQGFQVLVDDAVAELEAGKGNAGLRNLRAVLEQKMKPVFNAHPGLQLAGVETEVTKSDFVSKKKRHLDIFHPEKKAASAEIEAYAKDETSFNEKSMPLSRIYDLRAQQIAALERLFGFATDKGKVTAESAENAAAINATGGFKLHDNDSWRRFLLQKFQANQKASRDDWKALLATIDLLHTYLAAFTFHTPYNIDEFGDNYLTRTFPRALTGQLIHDCGVYALRIAYALSLIRTKLNLTFRAIVLPLHVGLIISFGDDVSRGAIFVQNDQLLPMTGAQLSVYEKEWRATDATGAK